MYNQFIIGQQVDWSYNQLMGNALLASEPQRCLEIPDLFSDEECQDLIRRANECGFSQTDTAYPAAYRNNDRLVLDDEALAALIYDRIRHHLAHRLDTSGRSWKPIGCNAHFRFCRYAHGQAFTVHRDGAYARSNGDRSWMTCQVYLNSQQEFVGGETRFYSDRDDTHPDYGVIPHAGKAILFDHAWWHDGAPVTSGTKYVMRTDVMFATVDPAPSLLLGHDGYVWAVTALDEHTFLSGGRDGRLTRWARSPGTEWTAAGFWKAPGREGQSIISLACSQAEVIAGTREGEVYRFRRDDLQRTLNAGAAWPAPEQVLGRGPAVLSLACMDNRGFLAAFADGTVKSWNDAGVRSTQAHHGFIWQIISAGSDRYATAGEDGSIALWEWSGMSELSRIRIGNPIRSICFSGSGLIAGDSEGLIHLVSMDETGIHHVQSVSAHRGAVTSLVNFQDGFISTGEDGRVLRHDVSGATLLHRHTDFATCACQIGEEIFSGGYDGRLLTSTPA